MGGIENATKMENMHIIMLCAFWNTTKMHFANLQPAYQNAQIMIKEHMAQTGSMLVEMTDMNPPPHVNAPPPTAPSNSANVECMLDEDLYSIDIRGNTTKSFPS